MMPRGWRLPLLGGFLKGLPHVPAPRPCPVLGLVGGERLQVRLQTQLQALARSGRALGCGGKADRQTDRYPHSFPHCGACRGGCWQQRGVTDGGSPWHLSLAVTPQKLVFKLEFVSLLLFRTDLSPGPLLPPREGFAFGSHRAAPFSHRSSQDPRTSLCTHVGSPGPRHGLCGMGAGFGPVPSLPSFASLLARCCGCLPRLNPVRELGLHSIAMYRYTNKVFL